MRSTCFLDPTQQQTEVHQSERFFLLLDGSGQIYDFYDSVPQARAATTFHRLDEVGWTILQHGEVVLERLPSLKSAS